jgi:hypothetical protein
MTTKQRCFEICKRGKSKQFKFIHENVEHFFGFMSEDWKSAFAAQMYFRWTNYDRSDALTIILKRYYRKNYKSNAEIDSLESKAWKAILHNMNKSTMMNSLELWRSL